MARDKRYVSLINSQRWQLLRRDKLTANPLCERCEEEGRLRAASEVHHIKPIESAVTFADMQTLAYDMHNLRALCHECHVKTHTELGRSGRQATKKRNEDGLQRFRNKFL